MGLAHIFKTPGLSIANSFKKVFHSEEIQNELSNTIAEAIEPLLGSAGLVIIEHGDNAATPRLNSLGEPFTGQALWLGSVTPTNRIAGDMYFVVAAEPEPWSPLAMQGLEGWWNPDLISVADGADIVSFPDASGNNRHMAHWTTPKMKLDADGLGGSPALSVTTVGAALETAAFTALTGPLTVLFNARIITAGNSGYVVAGATAATPNNFGVYRNGTTGSEGYGARRGSTTISDTGGSDAEPHSVIAVMDGENSKVFVDGVQAAAGTLSVLTSDGLTKLGIGGRNNSGTIQTNPQTGTLIGDVALASTALDTDGVAEATAWLMARRGA